MNLPEIILLTVGLTAAVVAWITWQMYRTKKVYSDNTTQQFKRILEQGEPK